MIIICPDKATSTVPLYQPFHILRLSPACSATSRYFHLILHYQEHTIMMNASLDTTNITAINISTLNFKIWQYFISNSAPTDLQRLPNVSEVPVTQPCRDMINTSRPAHLFTIKDDDKDPSLMWTILVHPGTYIGIPITLSVVVRIFSQLNRLPLKLSRKHDLNILNFISVL